MRFLVLTIVTALLAWGIWTFLREPTEDVVEQEAPPMPAPPVRSPEDERATNRARLTTGTLVITVRDAKGAVPAGASAGYHYAGEDRVRHVNPQGRVRFTDAPLDTLRILARAPGFKDDQQRRPLQAGVRTDVFFVLKPE